VLVNGLHQGISTDFHQICWTYWTFKDATVTIELVMGSSRWELANNIPIDDNYYTWNIPSDLSPGTGYQIVLTAADAGGTTTVTSTSDSFELVSYYSDPEMPLYVHTDDTVYDSTSYFSKQLYSGGYGGSLSVDDGSYCKIRYSSYPFTLRCKLFQSLKFGSNSYTFQHGIGVRFTDFGDSARDSSYVKVTIAYPSAAAYVPYWLSINNDHQGQTLY